MNILNFCSFEQGRSEICSNSELFNNLFMKSLLHKALLWTLPALFISAGTQTISGQEEKPVKKDLKNTIKINITNPMIFGEGCYQIGYERTIGKHQSFSANLGRFSIPFSLGVGNNDSIKDITTDRKSRGLHFSGDYRFYLAKENKYNSPRGVYIGPYATYNSYSRDVIFSVNTQSHVGDVNADFRFRMISMGFQMGYQFVFWNRMSLDVLFFGPGIAGYKINTELDTTFDPEDESELFQRINEALKERVPGYDLVLNPGEYEDTGSFRTTSLGFRYVVTLGFRF